MPRTRAKVAELAEKLHIDEDQGLQLPTEGDDIDVSTKAAALGQEARSPLGEIALNSATNINNPHPNNPIDGQLDELRKSTRGRKGGRKGGKSKKANPSPGDECDPKRDSVEDLPGLVPDAQQPPAPTATQEAAETLRDNIVQGTLGAEGLTASRDNPQLAAGRTTRSKTVKTEEVEDEVKLTFGEAESQQPIGAAGAEPHITPTEITAEEDDESEPVTQVAIDAPPSPTPSAVPSVIAALRKDSLVKRTVSNKENMEPESSGTVAATPRNTNSYDALEAAVVTASTPPALSREVSEVGPPSSSALHLPEEDAVENSITTAHAPVETVHVNGEQQADHHEQVHHETPNGQAAAPKRKEKKPWEKPAPVVRTTKASQARISLSQGEKTVSKRTSWLGKPRAPEALGRSTSVKHTSSTKPAGTSKDTSSKTSDGVAEKRDVVIPHSKPRPMSVSFPAPPQPIKSSKAPTKSTFQLPGEAVAAKLKAQREERVKKEAEEAERKTFKARPVPASLKRAPSVRPTTASKARESLAGDKPTAVEANSHKRASSLAASTAKPRTVSNDSRATSATARLAKTPGLEPLKLSKRPSTALANSSKPQASLAASSASNGNDHQGSSKGTTKGKEVFSRASTAKQTAEKEKREKEEAAKRARAEAAERGRQLSREWAEKQRLKKAGAKADAKGPEGEKSETHPEIAGQNGVDQAVEAKS